MSNKHPGYMTTSKERLSYWTYFVGQNVYYNITAAFISTYLAMQGIALWKVSLVLLIVKVWDAINDPMMGALMDKMFAKKQDKRGKFRPWLLRSSPLIAITCIVFFTLPTFFEGITMMVVLFVCKILYEGSYTMFNIPMGSLLSAMSTNDSERASLSSARGVGSMIGNMLPGLAGPVIVGMFGDRESIGYTIAGVSCAVVGFIICFMHCDYAARYATRLSESCFLLPNCWAVLQFC